MWHPVEIIIKRFKSHIDTKYTFINGETVLIYGDNLDDPGSDSNGSGKSTILEAIRTCLVDIIDSEIGKDELIMDGYDDCEIDFTLHNPFINKTLRINRQYFIKGSQKAMVYDNGILNEKLVGTDDINKYILQEIGINKDDLINYFLIDPDNSNLFFSATDAKMKPIILRFSNGDVVDGALIAIGADISRNNSLIADWENKKIVHETKLQTLEEQILYEEGNKEKEIKEKVAELKVELDELISTQDQYELSILNTRKKLLLVQKELSGMKLVKIEDNKIESKKLIIKENEGKIDALNLRISELKKTISGKIKCPKCKYEWILENQDLNLASIEKELNKKQIDADSIEDNNKKIAEEIKKLKREIAKTEENNENCRRIKLKVQRLEEEIADNILLKGKKEKQIKAIKDKIIETRNQKKNINRIKELRESQEEELEKLEVAESAINLLKKQIEELEFWKINFGLAGFKSFLINRVLENIEGYTNYHLKKFKTDLMIKMEGYKKLKSGKLSEKINVLISKDGSVWKKFKRFSGGQRQRINVCGILTLQKLINQSAKSGGLDLLALDEFFERTDKTGQQAILNLLKLSKITTLMVSHSNNDIGWDNQVFIKYKNGISKIAKNE